MKKFLTLIIVLVAAITMWAQNNLITYTASSKLPETSGYELPGLRKDAFNVSVTSHTFANGQGIITFAGEVTHIGDFAFWGCSSLTSISIPNGVTNIGILAFWGCSSLTSITIPNSVTSIGNGAFSNCSSIISFNVDADNTHYVSTDGVLFNHTKDELVAYPIGKKGSTFAIPNSVTCIGNSAFSNCASLSSITIPNSVTSIGSSAFAFCYSLTSIVLPNSVTKIGSCAFQKCSYLTSITLSNSVTSIGDGAFKECSSLTSITLPNSVNIIGDYAFDYCPKLVVHVPSESLSRFKNMLPSYYTVQGDAENFSAFALDPKQSPLLAMVDNSLQLIEQTANNTIDANEQCEIRFKMTNNGKGAAIGCEVKVEGTGSTAGLTFASQELPSIPVGTTQTIEIPVTANMNTIDGTAIFTIEVTEPNGYGIDPMTLTVNTRAFVAPLVKIVDYAVSGNGTIQKKQPFDLQLLLQNTKYGKAEDVDVILSVPAGVSLWEGEEKTHYAALNGGEQQKLNYQLAISGNYTGTTVPINISIKEKYGKFSENKTINLALNQQLASATSVTLQGPQPQVQREAIAIGALGSAVDKNIPVSQTVNKNTFVVIIANENYMSVAGVPYALNDGMKFREYCQKTLGIPENNIKYVANATGNQIKANVQWLEQITNVFDNPNIIFYYAGHGIPDEGSKTAYLLPVDGIGTDVTTGYKLDDLYATLGKMPSAHTTIFLDACFSGSKREEGMLASARGVAIKAKSGVPQGNMVVFSAAQGDETAYPNNDEGHGMFTYYLLKKLQETSGDVTLYDLGNYITKNVSQQSILINGKSQTPSVTAAAALGTDWQSWKLK